MEGWKLTPNRLLALVATIIFAIAAYETHMLVSVPAGLMFLAASFVV